MTKQYSVTWRPMGRHVAVFAAVLALLAGACSDDGGVETTATTTTIDASVEVDEFGCPSLEPPTPELLDVGVVFEHDNNGADHEGCASGYATALPTSGPHFALWLNCGFYTEPVRDNAAVHALEHGAIWIAYAPDLSNDEVGAIETLVETDGHFFAAPYPGLKNSIVLSAWTRQLAVDAMADPLVDQFVDDFLGRRSTTAPEAGAACDGGFGVAPDQPDDNFASALEFAQTNS